MRELLIYIASVNPGFQLAFPGRDFYGQDSANLVTNDYRENVGVILANFWSIKVSVLPGACIAQMIVLPIATSLRW